MKMEDVLPSIIGKTITGIVVKICNKPISPSSQVFLIFSDNTSLEFYTTHGRITSGGGLYQGGMDEARHYLSDVMDITLDACLDENGKVVRRT